MPARINNSATLFIGGIIGATGMFAGIDLYTAGPSINAPSTGLSLYMSGLTPPSGSGSLNLYIQGDPLSFSGIGTVDLFIRGQGEELACPLYIRGYFTDSDFPLNNGSGISSYLNLYMNATGTNPPDAAAVYTSIDKYVNLTIVGGTTGISSGLNLYSIGASSTNHHAPLYVYGVSGILPTGMTLYCSGLGYISKTADMYIRGY